MNSTLAASAVGQYRLCPTDPRGPQDEDRILTILVVISLVVCLGLGVVLQSLNLPARIVSVHEAARHVTFVVPSAPETVAPVVPEPAPEPEAAHELTPETVLAQAVDLAVPETTETPAPVEEVVAEPEPVRRVYGVRRVYAQGLGSGAGGGSALVVKRGNTLDGKADTLTATERDLQGSLAPLSTVTQAPKPIERHKPGYSEALREAGARGTVKARLLIDTEGTVRRVEVLSDIGYDSRELAIAAFEKFRFRPALRDDEPVAVWITHKIRFEFQE
jgi:TonB family protein